MTMSRSDRERMYTEYLRVEGYRPDLDDDGKVRFHRRGLRYTITVEDLEEYFAVGLHCWVLKTEEDQARARKAALRANDETKVGRICLYPTHAYAQVSLYISPPDAYQAVFGRILKALDTVVETFSESMRQPESPQ